jgi:hypothetical protein
VLDEINQRPIEPPERDAVTALDGTPAVVSISDIHGYLGEARSALLALSDHPDYAPVVEQDAALRLHWAGGDEYVLVINGDLIDRGPHNEEALSMVARLIEEAPPGHVRMTLGNHEMGLLTPDRFGWDRWFSGTVSDADRRQFLRQIRDGHVVVAYDGYRFTYAHAGQPDPYDTKAVNDRLVAAAQRLDPVVGTGDDAPVQSELVEQFPRVLGLGGRTGRGPDAGLAWLDFEHMPTDAPRQIVGHTRHEYPTRSGTVICQNVIRNNRQTAGGEAVLVETPDRLVALGRIDDEVQEHEFSVPDQQHPKRD